MRNTVKIIFALLVSWVAITCIIQRFKCPQLTQTEIFLNIPNSFICDWYEC